MVAEEDMKFDYVGVARLHISTGDIAGVVPRKQMGRRSLVVFTDYLGHSPIWPHRSGRVRDLKARHARVHLLGKLVRDLRAEREACATHGHRRISAGLKDFRIPFRLISAAANRLEGKRADGALRPTRSAPQGRRHGAQPTSRRAHR